MEFNLPPCITSYLSELDTFIRAKILPLQHRDDNNRFFDHRRETSRTQWDNHGLPAPEWEDLLHKARQLSDEAGFYRFALPRAYGGSESADLNLTMCAIRLHLASHPEYGGGLSLANDLQNEHSVVANAPDLIMLHHYGTPEQREIFIPARLRGDFRMTFGLTEIHHGSDATHMDTTAKPIILEGGAKGFEINGNKKWQTGMHTATHMLVFARTSGKAGSAKGITAFIVPISTPGLKIESFEWTMNMPTDHATVSLTDVRVPASATLGPFDGGLAIAQTFTHENRIRQAASSCGAARYCVDRSVAYAKERKTFGRPLASNQGIQFPLVEQYAQCEMLRLLILKTAWEMDKLVVLARDPNENPDGVPSWVLIEKRLGHQIAACNFTANRLATTAADTAIQVHGGNGYSRHLPFEHIWRHFRRYRITEGSDEIQMRRVGRWLFGLQGSALPKL
ncbi:butyryl-CoA dehydrogenase [Pseudomassariella vexata]|uniref:Butyryl-CoA dehydrogenase n=1 Tax=Pseudomassariella vexata TaxID=1141098 RepID=A0A1Y2E099_9PEZI|nr:butyryl-CoA dehydrogenase [Pseudomassariella vexata]ORY64951.1 butyryl-CoA dehydrogenase [Pseudomassariella vexata]